MYSTRCNNVYGMIKQYRHKVSLQLLHCFVLARLFKMSNTDRCQSDKYQINAHMHSHSRTTRQLPVNITLAENRQNVEVGAKICTLYFSHTCVDLHESICSVHVKEDSAFPLNAHVIHIKVPPAGTRQS